MQLLTTTIFAVKTSTGPLIRFTPHMRIGKRKWTTLHGPVSLPSFLRQRQLQIILANVDSTMENCTDFHVLIDITPRTVHPGWVTTLYLTLDTDPESFVSAASKTVIFFLTVHNVIAIVVAFNNSVISENMLLS